MKSNFIPGFILLVAVVNITCTKLSVGPDNNAVQSQTAQADLTAGAANNAIAYFISKGSQYCTPNPLTFTTQSQLTFKAVFDSSCIYTIVNPVNQYDVNKLYGFSDCGSHHLINSARVGWRWSNDSLRIFAFVHNDGAKLIHEITTAKISSAINCRITCLNSHTVLK